MSQDQAPSPPQREFQFVDIQTGTLTEYGINMLDGLWRQIAAGFTVTNCSFSMASNVITLTPRLHEEGARSYGSGMIFTALANATSTGDLTAKVVSGTKILSTGKVLKDDGSTVASTGDIVSGKFYLFCYDAALDGGAGAFVRK